MFDNTCKFLAETFPADFASWLLGEAIILTKLEPSELLVESIRADSIIFLESKDTILHIEFQTCSDPNIPFRMADYRLRIHRKFPHREVQQVVIYLKRETSHLVFQTRFQIGRLIHEFDVIRLWEQPTENFKQYVGLLPLAVLTKTINPTETLSEVSKLIDNIVDRNVKSNVAAATAIISGLALKKEVIQRLLRSEIMKESVIYQEILLEGKAEGKAEEKTQIALNMIHSGISIDLIAQITGLSLDQIQKLQ